MNLLFFLVKEDLFVRSEAASSVLM